MESEKKCPLCGRKVTEGDSLCRDCQDHIDNQYTTNLFENPDSNNDAELIAVGNNPKTSNTVDSESLSEEVVPPHQKKRMSKTLIFILIGCVFIIILGIISGIITKEKRSSVENEQAFWDSCVVVNTPLAYAKYLVTYQEGIYIDEAHNRIRDLRAKEDRAWLNVKKSNDVNDYYNYLNENPNTPYIDAARLRMDSLSWIKVSKDASPEAYMSYINNVKLGNIKGIYLDLAQQEYDYLSQFKTLEGESLDSLRNQLGALYLALSVYDKDALANIFETQVNFYSDTLSSTAIIDHLMKDIKTRKLKKINLQANKGSVSAIKDGKGNIVVKLLVNKEEISNSNKKHYSIDSTNIEINSNHKITSIISK